MTRLAIVGMGKMGRAIAELAASRDFEVVARIDPRVGGTGAISVESLNDAEVAVEFSVPSAAPANVRALVSVGCPVVVGTTGWYAERDAVERFVRERGGAVVIAPNYSLGVAAFGAIVRAAAQALRAAPGFDVHLVETHHAAKKDAPSGTALTLEETAAREWGRPIPITSVRVGAVPGTHELVFDAPFEQIRLQHMARDRRVFADGALVAARWLVGRRGIFTMQDVITQA